MHKFKPAVAVLSYRLNNTADIIKEPFDAEQRDALKARIDDLREIQVEREVNDKKVWVKIQDAKVDYMTVTMI